MFRGGASPALAELSLPGVKTEWAWVGDAPHATRDPLEATRRRLGARSSVHNEGAELHGGAHRRVLVHSVLGSGLGRWDSTCVCKANARLGRARAALQWPSHGEVAV